MDKLDKMAKVLEHLATVHHNTLTGSKLHHPEEQNFRDCKCLTCQSAAEILDECGYGT